ITAKTGYAAYQETAKQQAMLENIAESAKAKGLKGIDNKVASAYDQMKSMQKEIDNLKNQIFALKAKEWTNDVKTLGNVDALIRKTEGMDAGALKDIVSNLKAQNPNVVCFFANVNNDKVVFVAGAGKDAVKKGVHAGNLVKKAAQICQGNGGGKPDMAQAGGKDVSKLNEAMDEIRSQLTNI
ncbi:MAG: alanine--tRNA ligase, partial [Faecalicoccus sp.]|nr:alanine--tRNA ligase [Faecalicoccus sp.]